MKIAVFGPGAMGSIFVEQFARAGYSVTLIARERRPAAKTDSKCRRCRNLIYIFLP